MAGLVTDTRSLFPAPVAFSRKGSPEPQIILRDTTSSPDVDLSAFEKMLLSGPLRPISVASSDRPTGKPGNDYSPDWILPADPAMDFGLSFEQLLWPNGNPPRAGLRNEEGADFSRLKPIVVSKDNYLIALHLAGACFPDRFDMKQITREYRNYIDGRHQFFEPALEKDIRVRANYVYTQGNDVVAFGGLYEHPDDPQRGWLSWFGVHPDHRRVGFGGEVLIHIESVAGEHGYQSLSAYTPDTPDNKSSHDFYERLGFSVGERFMVGDELVRVYTKTLR